MSRFEQDVHRYADRHRVSPGTRWAQVNGLREKTSLADRVEWDSYYIEDWSLWLDVKILLFHGPVGREDVPPSRMAPARVTSQRG